NLVYVPGSKFYEVWKTTNFRAVTFSTYVFNLTNPEQVLNGSRPKFKELGPFVYTERVNRTAVNFSDENPPKTIMYGHTFHYVYNAALSIGPPSEMKVIAPDLIYLYSGKTGGKPFRETTVDQLLWNNQYTVFSFALKNFGIYESRNSSIATPTSVNTGVEDIRNVGKVLAVDGKRPDMWRKLDHAITQNVKIYFLVSIFVTPVLFFLVVERVSPGLKVGASAKLLVSSICRSVRLYAVNLTASVHRSDVQLLVLSALVSDKADPATNWEERIYCKPTEACPPKGLISLRQCLQKYGGEFDMYASLPRFLNADERIRQSMDGIPEPNQKEHGSFIHVEPVRLELTGLTLEGLERIQVNVLMANANKDYQQMKGPYYFPITWYSREAGAEKETVDILKTQILDLQTTVALAVQLVCGLCGLLSLVFAAVLTTVCIRTKKQSADDSNSSTILTYTVLSLAFDDYDSPDVKVPPSPSCVKKQRDKMGEFIR
ncbi:hypothetical protein PHET_00396, partial [Paragonimus heterotremus]